MAIRIRLFLPAIVAWLALPEGAWAGMPSITLADLPRAARAVERTGLSDLALARVEVISFFLLGLLACAGVVRWVWNSLRKDFPVLPRLSYARAIGIIVLWGLLFVLVLTMISGARELMTPGAWEKSGLTYRLVQPPAPPVEAEISARSEALERLGKVLVSYARRHGGSFPTAGKAGEIPESLWQAPSPPGGRYLYAGGSLTEEDEMGRHPTAPLAPLAYEPDSAGPDRLVLMTDGSVRWMPAAELERASSSRKP
jgi:hypothetical protein